MNYFSDVNVHGINSDEYVQIIRTFWGSGHTDIAGLRGGNINTSFGHRERERIELKLIDLWNKRLEHPQNLSGGEKQRLSLLNSF